MSSSSVECMLTNGELQERPHEQVTHQ